MRRAIAICMSLIIAFNSIGAALASTTQPFSTPRLAAIHAELEALRAQIDRAQFDPLALVDRLDYDEAALIDFVREQIRLEIYPGLLRGARGTLMSRAGNALDQSVLLATLLREAGLDVRIKGTRLDEEQARKVLARITTTPSSQPDPFVSDAYREIADRLEDLTRQTGADRRSSATALSARLTQPEPLRDSPTYQHARDSAQRLEHTLERAGVQLNDTVQGAALLDEAADFYWVEYRAGSDSGWITVQPAFPESSEIQDLPPHTALFSAEIPESLQHRVRLQVFIEQRLGTQLLTHPLTVPWERPAANLHGVPLTFTNLPQALASGVGEFIGADTLLQQSDYILPVLQGDQFEQTRGFDLSGTPIDGLALGRSEAGVFKQLNRGFGSAASALSGEQGPAAQLTAQWLEITLIAPNGDSRTVRRSTYDAIGPHHRALGTLPDGGLPTTPPYSLLQNHTLMFATGGFSRGYTLDLALEQLSGHATLVDIINRARAAPDGSIEPVLHALQKRPAHWEGMTTLMQRFAEASELRPDRLAYRHAPALSIHSDGIVSPDRAQRIIDIVANPRRVLTRAQGQLHFDLRANLLAGAWDTHVEATALPPGDKGVVGAPHIFALAEAQAIPLRLLRSESELAELALTPDTRAYVAQDLARGYMVVLPEQLPRGSAIAAWWRIDPSSGETLGMGGNGMGVTMSEETVLTLQTIASLISIGAFYFGIYGCFANMKNTSQGSWQFLCCLTLNTVLYGVGGGVSNWIGSWAGVIVSISHDVTFGLYTMVDDPCARI